MLYDFHLHTCFGDGSLLPIELIRRAVYNGYTGLAVTEHASASNLEWIVEAVTRDCELAESAWQIRAVPGVELTHVPVSKIEELARRARAAGAKLIAVHGETPVEPVEPGTNLAALSCPEVDLLVHPGMLTDEQARLAAEHEIFLELSARRGHCLGNGRVASVGREAGARFLVNSDGHEPSDLLTRVRAEQVAIGAGLVGEELLQTIEGNPRALLERIATR